MDQKWIINASPSRRFLQPNQHALRDIDRVLHGRDMPSDVRQSEIRVPLGRRPVNQEAHQVFRSTVYRLLDGLGAGPTRQRIDFSFQNRWHRMSLLLTDNNFDTLYLTGVPFPKNFLSITKTILKRLFRVYAHIYHQHFSEVCKLQEEPHLNTSFKHFIFFVQVSFCCRYFLII